MISTHILDTTKGMPAVAVSVLLEKKNGDEWTTLATAKTNADGRIVYDIAPVAGAYRLTFMIEDYFKGQEHFFLNTPISFLIKDTNRKYHVPILLNPYGYSTYRGS